MSVLDDARALLAAHPVIDGHNDLPFELRLRCEERGEPLAYDPSVDDMTGSLAALHTDLPRLRAGGVGGQFWSAFVPSTWTGRRGVETMAEQVELIKAMTVAHPDDLAFCRTADDVEAAWASGRFASLIGVEGGHAIDSSLDELRRLAGAGMRYLTLTHNDNTPWADSATDEPEHGGLTDFGQDVVRELNRLGVIVDLSHVAETTMHAALDVSASPVVFSHSSCRALCSHPRNVPDDVLRRLPENGGVLMITFVPHFLHESTREWTAWAHQRASELGVDIDHAGGFEIFYELEKERPYPAARVSHIADHIEHARSIVGTAHVGIGGDFDGTRTLPAGMLDVSSYPLVFAELLQRGWDEHDLAALACRNVLRVLRANERLAG